MGNSHTCSDARPSIYGLLSTAAAYWSCQACRNRAREEEGESHLVLVLALVLVRVFALVLALVLVVSYGVLMIMLTSHTMSVKMIMTFTALKARTLQTCSGSLADQIFLNDQKGKWFLFS